MALSPKLHELVAGGENRHTPDVLRRQAERMREEAIQHRQMAYDLETSAATLTDCADFIDEFDRPFEEAGQ